MGAYKLALSLDGKALAADVMAYVTAARFIDSMDELDALTVRFDVPYGPDADSILALAKPGLPYELTITTADGELTATGDVMEASLRFRGSEGWSVTLQGLEGLHRLRGAQTPKVWTGAPNTFLSDIASRHGLTATAEGVDGNQPLTLQADEDDATFVKRIARDLNYYVRVQEKKLLFGRRHVAKGTKIKVDLAATHSVDLDVSLYDIVSKVTVVADDPTKSELVTADADAAKLKKISGGDDGPKLAKAAFKDRNVVIHNANCTVASLATALATAHMQRAAENLVRGTVRCDATPTALSGQLVEIENAPWPATGPFLICETRHIVEDRVYRTEIDFLSDTLPVAS